MTLLLTLLIALHPTTTAGQDQMNARGAEAMGFDQEKTAHHFLLYEDGGAIDISVKDPADATNRDAIRAHLPHIAMLFGAGQFDLPHFIHASEEVPGTTALTRLKDRIRYEYRESPTGGRLEILTTDPEALDALHAFLRFQISDHKTGDPMTPQKRGGR